MSNIETNTANTMFKKLELKAKESSLKMKPAYTLVQ
jgi:hypothetical protein